MKRYRGVITYRAKRVICATSRYWCRNNLCMSWKSTVKHRQGGPWWPAAGKLGRALTAVGAGVVSWSSTVALGGDGERTGRAKKDAQVGWVVLVVLGAVLCSRASARAPAAAGARASVEAGKWARQRRGMRQASRG